MRLLYILTLAITFAACEKVIDIDLNSSDPRVVIDAELSDVAGECRLELSRTLNFDDTIAYPRLSGALVTITEVGSGNVDTLRETSPGRYANALLAGIPGRTYSLLVQFEGKSYSAQATMPPRVELDSLLIDSTNFTGPRGPANPDGSQPVNLLAFAFFTEPVGQRNNYYFKVTQRDTLADDFFIYSDLGADGQPLLRPIFVSTWAGAEVVIDLQGIDDATYEYLNGLNLNLGQNSATPANPKGNITGGALGHFRVHTSSKQRFVVL